MQFKLNSSCTPEELLRNKHGEKEAIPFVFFISRWGFDVREVRDRRTVGSNIN